MQTAQAKNGRAAPNRRMGPENAATRLALMDATEAVMREEGYAAVTSRRVAERAGVNQQTVYYYFQNMDELLLAAYRRRTGQVLARMEEAMASEQPLHALWRASGDPADAVLTMEYLALSNHNDLIRDETVAFGERMRRLQADTLAQHIPGGSSAPGAATPLGVVMMITYVAHLMGFEATLGLRGGHEETRRLMDWGLSQLEPANASPASTEG